MRLLRLIFIFVFLSLALSYPTMAQEQAKAESSKKIAYIRGSVVANEKEGVLIYVKAINEFEAEFKPVEDRIKAATERANILQNEIDKARNAPSPDLKLIKEKQDELNQLKRECIGCGLYEAFKKRYKEMLTPIEEDIEKELKAFVKEKGYDDYIILSNESVKVECSPCQPDITKEFIAYYNAKHPLPAVTNSQTQVKLSEPR